MGRRSCDAQLRRGVRVLTAGAPPASATIGRIEGELGWVVTHIYGLTETAPFILVCEPRPEHAALDATQSAILKARQGVELITSGELRVVDDKEQQVPADGTTLGEIVVRGNVVMKGYYRDPEATAVAFRNGWFHTGDAAVVHPDGYVEIRDRFKDVIISGGENISSIELEGVLLTHPAVMEAAVVGMPHEKWGETPVAHVVLRPGASTTEETLKQHCRERMAHFKLPTAIHFVHGAAQDRDGKDSKVRAAQGPKRDQPAIGGRVCLARAGHTESCGSEKKERSMSDTGDSGFSRREFVQVAASGLALTAVPGWVQADANAASADKTVVLAQIPNMHAANVRRLQEWIALPSIAAENRNYPQGPEYMAKLARMRGSPA